MIQLQVLNYIINNNDCDFLQLYGKQYFPQYPTQYEFMLGHLQKYKNIPNKETMVEKFPDFKFLEVTESKKYLQDKLHEEYAFNTTQEILNAKDTNDGFSKDAVKAVSTLIHQLEEIKPPMVSYGTDIVETARLRYDTLLQMQQDYEEYFFSTGLPELDIALAGGLKRGADLILVYARTNNGKSYVAEKFAVSVWEKGYNVGFFSPEMTPIDVGYRFDTQFKHFDNHGISGRNRDFDANGYRQYIDTLTKKPRAKFNVLERTEFPNNRVTVSDIRRWVEALDLKFVVIDGISLLTNERANGKKSTTENLTEIAQDLMSLSIEKSIPIVAVHQSNRTGLRDKDGDVKTDAPELDTLRDSDGIAHNVSKAISVYKAKDTLKLYITKNRYGEKGQTLIWQVNFNTGDWTYTPNPKDGMALPPDDDTDDLFNDTGDAF